MTARTVTDHDYTMIKLCYIVALLGDVRDVLFGHLMTRVTDPIVGRCVWKCTACGKTHKGKNVIRDHIEVKIGYNGQFSIK